MLKRYVAEFLGTFVIVLAPSALSATGAASDLLIAALVSGIAVLAMIFALGPISAAHFNPAVTLSFALAKRFPWKYVFPYVAAQFLGSLAAAGMAMLLYSGGHGVHVPSDPSAVFRNLGTEIMISFFLMLVIIAVATDRRVSAAVPGLAIGAAVTMGVLIGGPITGGSMNPARSFGPAMFGPVEARLNLWLYFLGPCIGAVVAALLFEAIRLKGDHEQGAPNELLSALEDVKLNSFKEDL